jgi:ureidoacrylate peracid hydrolase
MVEELTPDPDEIVFPKTSSSVFISTNIDYVLRNLGTRYVIIAGCLTDQCVDSAVRDACDLGYLVTVPTDACVTLSAERHDSSLRNNRGYCRQRTTQQLVDEIARHYGAARTT